MSKTVEQRRSLYALECVRKLGGSGGYGGYVSYVSSLPASILSNGLGQAMAGEFASKEPGHRQLFDHVSGWLCGEDSVAPYRRTQARELLHEIGKRDQTAYVRAQAEAVAVLVWLKKFARALLVDEQT